jgi:hypothetical protein
MVKGIKKPCPAIEHRFFGLLPTFPTLDSCELVSLIFPTSIRILNVALKKGRIVFCCQAA